jgi:hypothetical protein
MLIPGRRSGTVHGSIFRAPAASSISAAVSAMSGIMARSFALQSMWIRSTGMPNASQKRLHRR